MGKRIEDDDRDEIKDLVLNPADGEIIKQSLEKIIYQTSRHLCLNTGLSIGTIVDWIENMAFDGIIGVEQCGEVPSYFLTKNKPKGKLYFGGKNTILVRDDDKPQGNTSALRIGERAAAPQATQTLKTTIKKQFSIDAAMLEQLAAEGLNQSQIAQKLQIGYSALRVKLESNKQYYEAYKKGRNSWEAKIDAHKAEIHTKMTVEATSNQSKKVQPAASSPVAEIPVEAPPADNFGKKGHVKGIQWTPDLLERLAAENFSYKAAAKAFNVDASGLRVQATKNGETIAAWKRGQATYLSRTGLIPKNARKPEIMKEPKNNRPDGYANPKRVKKTIDEKSLENLAAAGLSQSECARRLNVHTSTLSNKMKNFPELRESFDRGAASFNTKSAETVGMHIKSVVTRDVVSADDVDSFEAFDSVDSGDQQLEQFDEVENVEQIIGDKPESIDSPAVDRAVGIDSRFAHTLEEISDHGNSKGLIERMTRKLTEVDLPQTELEAPPVPGINSPYECGTTKFHLNWKPATPSREQEKEIHLAGGRIKISMDFNLFETTESERNFLFNLVGSVQEFEQSKAGGEQ